MDSDLSFLPRFEIDRQKPILVYIPRSNLPIVSQGPQSRGFRVGLPAKVVKESDTFKRFHISTGSCSPKSSGVLFTTRSTILSLRELPLKWRSKRPKCIQGVPMASMVQQSSSLTTLCNNQRSYSSILLSLRRIRNKVTRTFGAYIV